MIRAAIAIAALLLLVEFPVPWNFLWVVVLLAVVSEWTPRPLRMDATRATLWLIGRSKHDGRVRRARVKAGLAGPFGEHFECPGCGRLAGIHDAMAERDRLVVDLLDLPLDKWDALDDAALNSPQPVRAATLQRIASVTFDDADAALWGASRVRLLAVEGNGYRACRLYCAECYRQAFDGFEKELAQNDAATEQAAVTASRTARDPIPTRVRFEVLNRDGFRCRYCGRSQRDGAVLHVDHVVPFSKGGPTTEDNLITACSDCNLGKSDKPVLTA